MSDDKFDRKCCITAGRKLLYETGRAVSLFMRNDRQALNKV